MGHTWTSVVAGGLWGHSLGPVLDGGAIRCGELPVDWGPPIPQPLLRAGCSSSSAQTPHSRQLEPPLPLALLRGWGYPPCWAAPPGHPTHLGVSQDPPLSPLCLPGAG